MNTTTLTNNTSIGPTGTYQGNTLNIGAITTNTNTNYGFTYTMPNTSTPIYNFPTGTWTNNNIETKLHVKGDAEFEGDVKIKGKSLLELLERLEERLGVYQANEELESKYEELRELSRRYKELESQIKEKEKMWGILKK
jgi:hypothetical protein